MVIFVKKIIIPIIIAAVLGVGSGAAAIVANNSIATADQKAQLPELKFGKYYLNGDVNSDTYLEVTDNYVAVRLLCDDKRAGFEELEREYFSKDECYFADIDTLVKANIDKDMEDYCSEKKYLISIFGTPEIPYMILTHYT